MKKIKITEEQAKRLGLTNEDNLGSKTGQFNQEVISNGVISGERLQNPVERNIIIDKIVKFWGKFGLKVPVIYNPETLKLPEGPYLAYYDKTGKIILGRVINSKVGELKRFLAQYNLEFKEKNGLTSSTNDIKTTNFDKFRFKNQNTGTTAKQGFDDMISGGKPETYENPKNYTKIGQPIKKKKVKLTKEQYDRLKSTGLIKEGNTNVVDKTFKKEFAGKNIKNLKSVSEDEKFNVSQINTSIPASAQKTPKPVTENENLGEDKFKTETKELVKYLYRKSEELSPFWEENGVNYDDICDTLLSKNLIVKNGGKYQLSKKLGDPQAALQTLENELRNLVGEPTTEAMVDAPQNDSPELEMEGNYPDGAENDSAAPYNGKEPDMSNPNTSIESKLEVVSFNSEMSVLKGPDGVLYAFYYEHLPKEGFMEYASVPRRFVGKDENGEPEYDYDFNDVEIDADVISHYVNDKLAELSKGEGIDDYEQGVNLVIIDEPLKQELLSLYDKDNNLTSILGPIEESNFDGAMNNLKDNLRQAHTPKPDTGEAPEARQSRIVAKLQELKAKEEARRNAEQASIDAQSSDIDEMTSAGSSGSFVGPMSGSEVVKRQTAVPVVAEMTSGSESMGAYDVNALPGIGRNGEFKGTKKTKAEVIPQWAGGSFVKQPSCSKLDNNKSAQNGGCNQGAGSLKMIKPSGSINAPSLGENEILETVAKKTGKTIDEVIKIIQGKNIKG